MTELVTLRNLNFYAAIIHYCLAIGFTLYFTSINNQYANQAVQGFQLNIRDHQIAVETKNGRTSIGWNSNETSVVDLKVVQTLLISFFMITGTFHLFYFMSGGEIDGSYNKAIVNKNNYFRWIEYSITSTMMLYIIALTSGVKDTNVYTLIFSTNVAMIATGQMVEEAVRDGKNWQLPMIVGFLLLIFEFAVIARDFWNRLALVNSFLDSNPNVTNQRIPSWINAMIIVLFLLFSSFGFISLWGAYSNAAYESVEKLYLIFSMAAKTVLGGFIAYGVGQRQANNRTWIVPTPTPM